MMTIGEAYEHFKLTYFPLCSKVLGLNLEASKRKHQCLLSDIPADIVWLYVILEGQVYIITLKYLTSSMS